MMRLVLALLLCATTAGAVEPDEKLTDPALEIRAREISVNLRCVVCQNEPIDSSNAGVARDLRLLLRERLTAGDTNAQVYDYIVARYGDYVLLNPPWKSTTYVLWLTPIFLVLMGGLLVLSIFRRSSQRLNEIEELSPKEQVLLSEITERKEGRDSE